MNDEFFLGLEEFEAKREKEKEANYGKRVLKKIIKRLNPEALSRLMMEAGNDFGLEWFNDTQQPPVLLAAKKLTGVTLASLLSKTFLDGKVAKAYIEEFESYGAKAIGVSIGVIFPIDSSQWIITDATIKVRGTSYVQLHANSDDVPSLAVMRLDDFVDALKRQGYGF